QRLTTRLGELEKAAAAPADGQEAAPADGAAPTDEAAATADAAPPPAAREAGAVAADPAATLRATFLSALAEVNRSRDHAGARAHAEKAVALAPELPAAHLALGRVLADEGDRAGAEQHLRRAADAGDAEALHALGLLLLDAGDKPAAEPLLARWLKVSIEG